MQDPFAGGEDRFLARLARLAGGVRLPRGTVGIGDDAAVLPGAPCRVVSVDQLVEGLHFSFRWLRPEALGRRAVERALSDVAAMGARAEGLLLAMAWPAGPVAGRRAGRFLAGLRARLRERGLPLLGGDTTRAPSGRVGLALTALGRPWPGGPTLRSGGRPGDRLVVTGPLGGAGAGLARLSGALPRPSGAAARRAAEQAVAAFHGVRARLDLARPLARHARALIDLSDGLGLDLPRLARACRCGFEVEAARLPLHPALVPLLGEEGAFAAALGGGEDYELLAALPPAALAPARRAARRAGGVLYEIGRLVTGRSGTLVLPGGRRRRWPRTGWDPFDPKGLDGRGARRVGAGDGRGRRR